MYVHLYAHTHTHTLVNFCIFVFMKDLYVVNKPLVCMLSAWSVFAVCVCVCVCICDHVYALPCVYGVCVHVCMPLDYRLFVHPIHSLSIHFA